MADASERPSPLSRTWGWGVALIHVVRAGWFRRGPSLAPGDLGIGSVARFGDDRFYARRSERFGPIFKVLWSQRLTTCVVGLRRARHLFAVHARALLPLTIDISHFVPYGFIRSMPHEQHVKYRQLFLTAMRDDLTLPWEQDLRALIRAELATISETTRTNAATEAPVLTPALDRIATRALLQMCFGVRPTDPPFATLEAAYRRMGPSEFAHPVGPEQRAAFEAIREVTWGLVGTDAQPSRTNIGDSVLRRLATSSREAIDQTVVGNLIYMVEMGRYDVRSLMRWVLKYLTDAPDVLEALSAGHPSQSSSERCGLAEAAVLETLRLDQAEALNRAVTDDIAFEGYRIPKGSVLRVLLRESHRDPAAFADPDTFKPCRWVGTPYPSHTYAPFGLGDHRCIAAQMVVRLTTLLVEELAAGFTCSVVADGPRHRGRYHWEPAPGFELALRRREPKQACA
jgi:cytochrome P450